MTCHEYITNMSTEGTWGDHIIMQAIAETMNLRIYIAESSENFAEFTLVEPLNMSENCRSIYIGHIGEMHYASTVMLLSKNSSPETVKRNLFDDSSESVLNKLQKKMQ